MKFGITRAEAGWFGNNVPVPGQSGPETTKGGAMPRKFGIEVEYGPPAGRTGNAARQDAISALRTEGLSSLNTEFGYSGHSQTEWVVKYDGSCGDGGEMVSPPLDFEDPAQRGQVNRAIKALRSTGAKVDNRAGIHIHIDCSDLTAEQVACVARTFTKFEDVLFRIASSGWRTMRPGSATYCKPLTDQQIRGLARARTKEQVGRAYFGRNVTSVGHGDPARYHALNLQSWFYRGTIEFRLFNSSLNPERIQAYIAICMALVDDARSGKKRSVNKAYRLGGMAAGTTSEKAAYHRFQQVVRYEAGMSIEDYRLMNKVWKDSTPQRSFARAGGW